MLEITADLGFFSAFIKSSSIYLIKYVVVDLPLVPVIPMILSFFHTSL